MTIEFAVGDYVKKVTGEYQIYGTVVSVFKEAGTVLHGLLSSISLKVEVVSFTSMVRTTWC